MAEVHVEPFDPSALEVDSDGVRIRIAPLSPPRGKNDPPPRSRRTTRRSPCSRRARTSARPRWCDARALATRRSIASRVMDRARRHSVRRSLLLLVASGAPRDRGRSRGAAEVEPRERARRSCRPRRCLRNLVAAGRRGARFSRRRDCATARASAIGDLIECCGAADAAAAASAVTAAAQRAQVSAIAEEHVFDVDKLHNVCLSSTRYGRRCPRPVPEWLADGLGKRDARRRDRRKRIDEVLAAPRCVCAARVRIASLDHRE